MTDMHASLDDLEVPVGGGGQTSSSAAPMVGTNGPAFGGPGEQPPAAGPADSFKRYVLYVGPSVVDPQQMCPGSRAALELIKTFEEDVAVADVNRLRLDGEQLPAWLEGTPCVVNTAEKLAYMGSHCIAHLKQHSARMPLVSEFGGGVDGVDPDGEGFAALEWSAGPSAPQTAGAGAPPRPGGRAPAPSRDQKLDEGALQRMIEERLASTASRMR